MCHCAIFCVISINFNGVLRSMFESAPQCLLWASHSFKIVNNRMQFSLRPTTHIFRVVPMRIVTKAPIA